jgi:hypothetical protein
MIHRESIKVRWFLALRITNVYGQFLGRFAHQALDMGSATSNASPALIWPPLSSNYICEVRMTHSPTIFLLRLVLKLYETFLSIKQMDGEYLEAKRNVSFVSVLISCAEIGRNICICKNIYFVACNMSIRWEKTTLANFCNLCGGFYTLVM